VDSGEVNFLNLSVEAGEGDVDRVLSAGLDSTSSPSSPSHTADVELDHSDFKPVHGNTGMRKFGGRPKGSENGNKGQLKAWQIGVVDYMLENPSAKRKQIAANFNVTPEWLSAVMNSDSFLSYQAERIAAHQSVVSGQIVVAASEVAMAGLKKIKARIEAHDDVATSDAIKATEMAGKMLGIGVAKGPMNGPVQINNYGVDAGLLADARAKMEALGTTRNEDDPLEGLFEIEGEIAVETITKPSNDEREGMDSP
jgi:hypothetical protein